MLAEPQNAHTLHLHRSLTSDLSESTLVGNAAKISACRTRQSYDVSGAEQTIPVARRAISDVISRRQLGDTMLRVEHATCNKVASTASHLKLRSVHSWFEADVRVYLHVQLARLGVLLISSCTCIPT